MAYRPLGIDQATPPRAKALIRALESHYLNDSHTMLRLPDFDRDLVTGCTFAITQVLAAAVSGISVTLYGHKGSSGTRFKGLLKDYYPWRQEPASMIPSQEGANVLYSVIRNPLTHDLGLDLENKRHGQKIVIKRLATDNKCKGLPEHFIERLESPNRPIPMSPTVRVLSGKTVVLVEAFYWGIRQMVEQLSRDSSKMQLAETFLASI